MPRIFYLWSTTDAACAVEGEAFGIVLSCPK